MSDIPVYSTKTGSNKRQKAGKNRSRKFQPGEGPAKMRLESKGRGGKSVTVLWNLPWSESEAKRMMKAMQGQFGCGATLKSSQIELQGDCRDQVEAFFRSLDLSIKRAGG